MAISYIGAHTEALTIDALPFTGLALAAAGLEDGDVLVAFLIKAGTPGGPFSEINGDPGWTWYDYATLPNGDDRRLGLGIRAVPDSGDLPDPIELGNIESADTVGTVMVWRGVNLDTPIDVAVPGWTDTDEPAPITTQTDGAAVLVPLGCLGGVHSPADPPVGYSLASTANLEGGQSVHVAYRIVPTAGLENPEEWQSDLTGGSQSCGIIALRDADADGNGGTYRPKRSPFAHRRIGRR